MELNYKIQTYAWGKKGLDSKVAALYANVNENFKPEGSVPYAELWLGTHVNGPSSLKSGQNLDDLLQRNPHFLGENVRKTFGNQLPFLFKVLSVNQALSVQAHPTKRHAEELHRKFPDIYKDPNHKPELAIALTPFEALCGFRPLDQVSFFLRNIPELNVVTGNVTEKHKKDNIDLVKDAFKSAFTCDRNVVKQELSKLLVRLKPLDAQKREKFHFDLLDRLHQNYPGDVGCFMVFFLNYLKLKPFEAIYLEANLPHAYISGDCVECMACSDNVVRAGLTPKFIDVDTLCSMVIYEGERAEEKIFKPVVEDELTVIFKPPVPDFAVVQIRVPSSAKTYLLKARSSASILLVIEGQATLNNINLKTGTAIFIPADQSFEITNISSDLLLYQGLANV